MKNIASQIRVESVTPVAVVNWTAAPILIFPAAPKFYAIVPEYGFQSHRAFDRLEIRPVDHRRTSSELTTAPAHISYSKAASDSRPSTNWRAISLRHCLTLR